MCKKCSIYRNQNNQLSLKQGAVTQDMFTTAKNILSQEHLWSVCRIINVLFYYDRCFGESAVGHAAICPDPVCWRRTWTYWKKCIWKNVCGVRWRVTGYHNTRLKVLDSSSWLDTKTGTGHINVLFLGISISPDANSEWSYLENRKKYISLHPAVYTWVCFSHPVWFNIVKRTKSIESFQVINTSLVKAL